MRSRRAVGPRAAWSLALTLATVGAALAQQPDPVPPPPPVPSTGPSPTPTASPATVPPPTGASAGVAKARKKGGLLAPGGPRAKALRKDAADPFAKPAEAVAGKAAPAIGTFHYGFKVLGSDGMPLAATYYPSRLGTGAAIVMLVHERDRSSKDFDDKIAELDHMGLAEALQKQGYAVLALDLRGHGANARRTLNARDWRMMVGDLQSAYLFLIDRHNRGEINLSRLGVVALGEGANLVATWASLPGGAVSSQGRNGDLGGLVLISPMIDSQSQGLRVQQPLTALAPRIPLCILAGERDQASAEIVKAAKPAVVRVRANKVELFPSSLHGFKLLRLEPHITTTILRFFDETIKAKAEEWEPRYNLDPVAYSEVQLIPNTSPPAGLGDAPKAKSALSKDEAK